MGKMGLMTNTRWLTDAEQRVWRDFIGAVGMLNAHLDSELQRTSGMPATYYEVLVRLSEAPERTMRMSELAEASNSSRSRLSHAVARLESAGWVHRKSCPTDKRGSFASLTPDGFSALEQAAPGHVQNVRSYLFDLLTLDQVNALGEISAAIKDGLAARCAQAAQDGDGAVEPERQTID